MFIIDSGQTVNWCQDPTWVTPLDPLVIYSKVFLFFRSTRSWVTTYQTVTSSGLPWPAIWCVTVQICTSPTREDNVLSTTSRVQPCTLLSRPTCHRNLPQRLRNTRLSNLLLRPRLRVRDVQEIRKFFPGFDGTLSIQYHELKLINIVLSYTMPWRNINNLTK